MIGGGATSGHQAVCNGLGCAYITASRDLYKPPRSRDIDVLTSAGTVAQCQILPGKPYRYLLRIPEELREKLAESAKEQGRSFNAEVGHRLTQSFESPRSRLLTFMRGKGREMDFSILRRRPRWAITGAMVAASITVVAGAAFGVVGGDDPSYQAGTEAKVLSEFGRAPLQEAGSSAELMARNAFFMSRRTAGTSPLDATQAGIQRAQGQAEAKALRKGTSTTGPTTFDAAWTGLGPNPIVQGLRSPGPNQRFGAMSGRIGAMAIRKDGTILLAGAQGGIWKWAGTASTGVGSWTALTDNQVSLAMGSLAVAPSNDNIVYGGTGEGHLSGDSYFGNGVLKSTDGGNTWTHVSGDYFRGVAISRIVVDPANASHLYAAVLRGRGGARRVTPPVHSRYGIWESTNGGVSWTLLKEATEANGATDLEMDPQNTSILYASFWGDAIYKSTNGGATWARIMNGIPGSPAQHAGNLTRFSIAISHPAGSGAVLYAGFDWVDATGYHPSRVFKSENEGISWSMLPRGSGTQDNVEDYCGGQCFYDNVIEAAPDNPSVVYAGGQFNYGIGSGGFFRSDDGGQTWINLGYDQHPDFQAFAFDPNDSNKIVYGSDGGVWYSLNRGGRLAGPSAPLSAVNWQSLNGTVDPLTALVTARTGLQIAQFTSIATVPTVPARFWGGTQDNGTLRKSGGSATWFDIPNGDGGQVLVDPTPDQPAPELRRVRAGVLRVRHVLRHLAISDERRWRDLLQQQRDHERHQPGGSLDLLHPDGDEQGQAEPALPRHVSALPHEQRQDADCRGRPLGQHQPRPDGGLRGDGSERGTRVLPLGNRPRGR